MSDITWIGQNEYEERNRAAKVYKLVRFAESVNWTAEDMEAFSRAEWLDLADAMGINPPSDRTKAIVLHVLRERSNG